VLRVFDPPIGYTLETPLGGLALGDVPLDSVEVAPTTGYAEAIDAEHSEEPAPDRTYVLKTQGGGHAVIRIHTISLDGIAFDYKYQNDGSGVFKHVSVAPATWSQVKFSSLRHQ
jgi:hypothetical protein